VHRSERVDDDLQLRCDRPVSGLVSNRQAGAPRFGPVRSSEVPAVILR